MTKTTSYVIVYFLRQQKMGVEVKYLTAAVPHPTSLGELTELPRNNRDKLHGRAATALSTSIDICTHTYCLPCSLGSALLRKVQHKECIYININLYICNIYINTHRQEIAKDKEVSGCSAEL